MKNSARKAQNIAFSTFLALACVASVLSVREALQWGRTGFAGAPVLAAPIGEESQIPAGAVTERKHALGAQIERAGERQARFRAPTSSPSIEIEVRHRDGRAAAAVPLALYALDEEGCAALRDWSPDVDVLPLRELRRLRSDAHGRVALARAELDGYWDADCVACALVPAFPTRELRPLVLRAGDVGSDRREKLILPAIASLEVELRAESGARVPGPGTLSLSAGFARHAGLRLAVFEIDAQLRADGVARFWPVAVGVPLQVTVDALEDAGIYESFDLDALPHADVLARRTLRLDHDLTTVEFSIENAREHEVEMVYVWADRGPEFRPETAVARCADGRVVVRWPAVPEDAQIRRVFVCDSMTLCAVVPVSVRAGRAQDLGGVRLEPCERSVRGEVVDSLGRPIRGARVRVQGPVDKDGKARRWIGFDEIKSGADGGFELRLPARIPSAARIRVSRYGYVAQVRILGHAVASRRTRFVLEPRLKPARANARAASRRSPLPASAARSPGY